MAPSKSDADLLEGLSTKVVLMALKMLKQRPTSWVTSEELSSNVALKALVKMASLFMPTLPFDFCLQLPE